MIRYSIGAFAAVMVAGAAQAATPSPLDIVNHHVTAVAKSDVAAMMADYADDAVVLEAGQAMQGKAAIHALYERLFPKQPAGAAPSGVAAMKVKRIWQEGDVGFVNWQMGTTNGTDEFLIRDGKIAVQAVFMGAAAK